LSEGDFELIQDCVEQIEVRVNRLDAVNSNGGLPAEIDEGEVLRWQKQKLNEILAKSKHA
jgi:hypothetical protein